MLTISRVVTTVAAAFAAILLAPLPLAAQTSLTGAGATFPAPIYQKWFNDYHSRSEMCRSITSRTAQAAGSESTVRPCLSLKAFSCSSVSGVSLAPKSTVPSVIVLGETMAVTMVSGNTAKITASLLSPGYSIAAVIANEFTEASGSLYVSSLIFPGLVLFGLSIVINAIARIMVLTTARSAHKP